MSAYQRRLGFLVFVPSLVVLLLIGGCNSASETGQNETTADEPLTASKSGGTVTPASQSNSPLVGAWFGTATLNRVTLQNKLDSIRDPAVKAQLESMAKSFLSIKVGAHFEANGKMEFEVEMQGVNGQYHRDSSTGTWKTLNLDGETLTIEKIEQLADGSTVTKTDNYNFINNFQQFAMTLPTAPELKDCNPIILFYKQDLSGGTPKVADRPGDNSTNTNQQ